MKTAFSTSSKSRLRRKIRRARQTRPRLARGGADIPKLFLCDLGNVLINFDHRIAVRRIAKFTDKNFDDVYQFFFDSPLTKDFEEGRVSPREFFRRLAAALNIRRLGFKDFVPIWNDIFFDNEGMLDLLKELKKKYRLHLVSNINELHYGYIRRRFPEHIAVFDAVYLSCRLGARKPAPEIYRRAIEDKGFGAHEVFYADDRSDLTAEAEKLGIRSFVFSSVRQFRAALRKSRIHSCLSSSKQSP